MSDVVIRVENLSKHYRLGQISGGTLREDLQSWWAGVRGRADPLQKVDAKPISGSGEHWALTDVSFDVRQGEVLGIIGRNGAGKSTLLKILSRTTAPTKGRVRIKGRVGSLLEVGTGFHPELSGRENIYLNGTILGMRKAEIDRKLDEIIDFSGVEKYIDTPVKRYSSGMYVRLAFAVAAHLEPEILIVDEVLAVGDKEFQDKCLGKMSDVAAHGRTIIFVSHNMQAVRSICTSGIILNSGRLHGLGTTAEIINRYIASSMPETSLLWVADPPVGDEIVQLKMMSICNANSEDQTELSSDSEIVVTMKILCTKKLRNLCVGFDLFDAQRTVVLRSYDTDNSKDHELLDIIGDVEIRCSIPPNLLNGGSYEIAPRIGVHNQYWIVNIDPIIRFDVVLTHGKSWMWSGYADGGRPGGIAPILKWRQIA